MKDATRNRDIEAMRRYHDATKHSEAKLRHDPHFLDWGNRPQPFKIYRNLESVPLPSDRETLLGATPPALEAITGTLGKSGSARPPDLTTLARVLYLAAGITKRKRFSGGEMYFRAYANTGALYHIDVYLVTGDLPDLPAGVYQFGPHDFALHRLRLGDYRSMLSEGSGNQDRVTRAALTLVSASTYWRNAWKYRDRTYRHCFWDAGTLHANLLAIADAEALRPLIVLGFVDATIGSLLALDPEREGPLTLVPLGYAQTSRASPPPMPALTLETLPLSRVEVDYPMVREAHAASSLASPAEAAAWRSKSAPAPSRLPAAGPVYPLVPTAALPQRSLAEVIGKRGSTRAFDRTRPLSFGALSTVLERATGRIAFDLPESTSRAILDLYLIVHAVDDLPAGAYHYRREERSLELLRAGSFRAVAGRLGLGQELPADAAVNVYSLCSLPDVLERFGNRGYRVAQLAGGVIAGRMYIAAYAQGFGATGLTFFDDEVTEFFSPHATGKSVMFLVALGFSDRSALGRRG